MRLSSSMCVSCTLVFTILPPKSIDSVLISANIGEQETDLLYILPIPDVWSRRDKYRSNKISVTIHFSE